MVPAKVGRESKTSALSISPVKGRRGRRKIFANGTLKQSDNWGNVQKTANSSTLRYALEPTTKKGVKGKESWPEVKSSWEKTKDKKADCWQSHHGRGEGSDWAQAAKWPRTVSLSIHSLRYFPWPGFYSKQRVFLKKKYSHTPFPCPVIEKLNKISKSLR